MLATRRGGFTIGGGVPRNCLSNFGGYAECGAARLQKITAEAFNYGVRICPDASPLGRTKRAHVYGSSFLGASSSAGRGGRFAEVFDDANGGLP